LETVSIAEARSVAAFDARRNFSSRNQTSPYAKIDILFPATAMAISAGAQSRTNVK